MRSGTRGLDLVAGGLALLLAAGLVAPRAWRGWIPNDEGVLAQSAERVLAGELPHRDFDAAYTGGLELLHAAAFRVLGVQLASERWVLLAFALAFVAALYVLARSFAGPPLAAVLTVAAVVWSLPNYFAGLPSWYILFAWTFGGTFLLAYARFRQLAWLVAAGACAGLAFLAKVPGILFLGVAFLFVVFDEQAIAASEPERASSPLALWTIAAALGVLTGGLLALVWHNLGAMELLVLVVPTAALSATLVWQEVRLRGDGARARRLVVRGALLAAGAAVPIAIFLVPYGLSGSWGDLWRGVFVVSLGRLDTVAMPLPRVWTAVAALLLAIPLSFPGAFARWRGVALAAAAVLGGVVLLALAGRAEVHRWIWYSVRPLGTVAVVLGCLTLARRPREEWAAARGGFLVLSLAALLAFIQYPYGFALYFFYTAPLVVLAVAWTGRERGGAHLRPFLLVALGFYAAFAVVWVNRGYVRATGSFFFPNPPERRLALPRAGIAVPVEHADEYEQLVAEIALHSSPGEYIYAGPGCPEVYFLAERRNPTHSLADGLDLRLATPALREQRFLLTLADRQVRVVVLYQRPEFSPTITPTLLRAIAIRYPSWKQIGEFVVMWRD
jgi:hypothetical protein